MGINDDYDDDKINVFLDQLWDIRSSVSTPEDVVRLIEKMREGLRAGALEFALPSDYIAAMEEVLDTLPGNCAFQDIPCPDPPSWHLVGHMLARAMIVI